MVFFSEFIGNEHIAQRTEYIIKCFLIMLEGYTMVQNASQFRVYLGILGYPCICSGIIYSQHNAFREGTKDRKNNSSN